MSSERVPTAPRSNPLYGGPSGPNPGPKTPSWARRSAPSTRSSNFSDVASFVASTPPDSPARDHYSRNQFGQYNPPAYEHPGYTVETPSHSDSVPPSPYRAPPYYVQTPAMSERGGTPLSSAPSSPPHYGQSGVPFIETSKSKSSRVNPMKKVNMGKAVPLSTLEEGEDEFPDLDRDRRRKRAKNCWTFWIIFAIVVFLIGLGCLITWLILRPKAPHYIFQDLDIHSFYLQQDKPDSQGVATDVIYANFSMLFTVTNPNKRYGMRFDNGDVGIGYSSLDNIINGGIGSFHLSKHSTQNFTVWADALRVGVYSAGHHMELDIANAYLPLNLQTNFHSHVSIFWKIIRSSWVKSFDCTLNIRALRPYRFINTTCTTV